jgi:hypothetical protein
MERRETEDFITSALITHMAPLYVPYADVRARAPTEVVPSDVQREMRSFAIDFVASTNLRSLSVKDVKEGIGEALGGVGVSFIPDEVAVYDLPEADAPDAPLGPFSEKFDDSDESWAAWHCLLTGAYEDEDTDEGEDEDDDDDDNYADGGDEEEEGREEDEGESRPTGTRFTCFNSAKVQILTQYQTGQGSSAAAESQTESGSDPQSKVSAREAQVSEEGVSGEGAEGREGAEDDSERGEVRGTGGVGGKGGKKMEEDKEKKEEENEWLGEKGEKKLRDMLLEVIRHSSSEGSSRISPLAEASLEAFLSRLKQGVSACVCKSLSGSVCVCAGFFFF